MPDFYLVLALSVSIAALALSSIRPRLCRYAVMVNLAAWVMAVAVSWGRDEMQVAAAQWWAVVALVGFLTVSGVYVAWKAKWRNLDSTDGVLVLCGLLALTVRLVLPHQILHVELMGGAILDDYFRFPEPSVFRATYGQTSFMTIGVPGYLWPSISTITTANAVVSAATATFSGFLVRSISGQSAAAVVTAVCVALHPCLALAGTSEDSQTVGFAALVLGWLLLDRGAATRRAGPMAGALALLVLAAWSRQTLVPMTALPFLACIERDRRVLRNPAFLGAATGVLGAVGIQVVQNLKAESNAIAIEYYVHAILHSPKTLLAEPHPLLDPTLNPFPMSVLTALGLFASRACLSCRWTLVAGFIGNFVITSPLSVFGPGVQVVLRTPLLLVGAMLAGIGAARLFGWLRRLPSWSGKMAAACLFLVFLACATRGMIRLAAPDPQTEELAFLESSLPTLPSGTVVVVPDQTDLFPNRVHPSDMVPIIRIPDFLRRANPHLAFVSLRDFEARPLSGEALFYRGLGCYAVTLLEGSTAFRHVFLRIFAGESVPPSEFLDAAYGVEDPDRQPSEDLARALRQVCFDSDRVGPSAGPTRIVTKPFPTFTPNLYFPFERMEIGFFRLARVPSGPER